MFKILNKKERLKKKYEKNYINILKSCELFEENDTKDIFFTKLKITNTILTESSSNLSYILFDKEIFDLEDLITIPRNAIINNLNKIKIKSIINNLNKIKIKSILNRYGYNNTKESIDIYKDDKEQSKNKHLKFSYLKKNYKINPYFKYKVNLYLFYKKQFETFSNNSMPKNYINIAYNKMIRAERLVLLQLSELKEEYIKKFVFLEFKTEINLDLIEEYSALSDLIFNDSRVLDCDNPYKTWTINKPKYLEKHFDNLGFLCIYDFSL